MSELIDKAAQPDIAEGVNLKDYDFTSLSYPLDLSDKKYGGHRVVFFINVQGGGSIARDSSRTTTIPPNAMNRKMAGEQLAKEIAGKVGLKVTSPNKRLKSAIQLYIPEALNKSYSVDWGTEDMGLAENIAQAILKGRDANANTKGAWETTAGVAGAVGSVAAETGASMLINGSRYAQKATSITPGNSKAQLLFNQVDFGTFSFDYRFAPVDTYEAKAVMDIIRTFRHHMLPEYVSNNQYLYVYPSEFDIAYYFGDKENEFLEKHITAVLTNMNISYNPNGQFTTFSDGMPTHINVTLTFKELGVPTKEVSPADKSGA